MYLFRGTCIFVCIFPLNPKNLRLRTIINYRHSTGSSFYSVTTVLPHYTRFIDSTIFILIHRPVQSLPRIIIIQCNDTLASLIKFLNFFCNLLCQFFSLFFFICIRHDHIKNQVNLVFTIDHTKIMAA